MTACPTLLPGSEPTGTHPRATSTTRPMPPLVPNAMLRAVTSDGVP